MIHWAEWSAAAFARARRENKPVLLSLTATWCHACHRMDDETWSDPGVASVVERAAVPVRVDADARPDVYGRFHLGGLPTTALLGAEADFIRGGTFLSPIQCLAFLDAAMADWKAGRRPTPRPAPAPASAGDLVDDTVEQLCRRADLVHGGFGAAPKLPEPDALTLLLRCWQARRDARLERIARLTLDAVAAHLVDPADGGFFRYAAGADWSGPHTEKLTLDQAALIGLYLEASATLGQPRYAEVARGALSHARRRLLDPQGRVLASVAAASGPQEDDAPPVDNRCFADAAAAMISATRLALTITGEDMTISPELFASAPSGAIPHQLDAPPGVSGLLQDQALAITAAVDDFRRRGDPASLRFAVRAADWSLTNLQDDASGALRSSPPPQPGEIALPPMVPLIANGQMAQALAALAGPAARPDLHAAARSIVAALTPRALRSPAAAPLALAALSLSPRMGERAG